MRSLSRRLALIAGALLCSSAALAQPFPNEPIKAVVPFAAGSATDQIGRAFAAKISPINDSTYLKHFLSFIRYK